MKNNKKIIAPKYRTNRNILIEEYNVIYFHTPKNGCTSFKTALIPHIIDSNYEGSVHQFDFPSANFDQLDTKYNDCMKFALVRNPWSLIVSCFQNKIRAANINNKLINKGVAKIFNKYKDLFYGGMPFTEFVDSVCSIPESKSNPHFISQLYWLTDFSGKLMPNYIGRLENVEDTINSIYIKTGLSLLNIEHKNSTIIKIHYSEYYDEILKEKVRNKFAADIEIFGYELEANSDIKSIGFIDDVFRERLAKSKFLDPLMKEKNIQLMLLQDKKKN